MKYLFRIVSLIGISAISLIAYSGSANAESRFSVLDEAISTNATGIAGNVTAIGNNETAIGNNETAIGNNETAINNNETAIFDNDVSSTFGINTNTGAISSNTGRISILEGGGSGGGGGTPVIPVDCFTDPLALKDMPLTPGFYVLTGMCDGPITFDPDGHYDFVGDGIGGDKDDGIASQIDQTEPFALGVYAVSVRLENLTISAANHTSKSDGIFVTAIGARASTVELFNVDVVGGDLIIYYK